MRLRAVAPAGAQPDAPVLSGVMTHLDPARHEELDLPRREKLAGTGMAL